MVPCGGCNLCCKSEIIALLPEEGDDVSSYDHEHMDIPNIGMIPVLKHKKNGDCVYLDDEKGCTIHGRAPYICRTFDCRAWFKMHSRKDRRKMAAHSPWTKVIFNRGRELLEKGAS